MQPVPDVSEDDVRRVIRRDFGHTAENEILSILCEYGREAWQGGETRVRVDILKLAGGDKEKVGEYTATACRDARDVMAWAEYPRYIREVLPGGTMDEEAKQRIIDADWAEYREWLSK